MPLKHLTDYLERNAEQWPDKPALVFDGKSLSWRQLWLAVQDAAAEIEGHLPAAGGQQAVGMLMPNSLDCVITNLAIVHLGHMVLPIDVIYKPLEINALIDQMRPALVITDAANTSRITTDSAALTLDGLRAGKRQPKRCLRLDPEKQIASLLFTSGTTGRPKAAPYTHANHMWNIKVCSQVWDWTHDDSQLLSLRLSHWYGIVMGLSGTLYHGNTMYLQEKFDEQTTLKALASGKISMFSQGPVAFIRLLQSPEADNYDLSAVRLLISGSAPLPPDTWRQFKDMFGKEILEVYGSSETGRIASNLLNERLPGSPGRPLPEVQVKLSARGEVLVKSPGVFPGYYGNPDATAAATAPGGWWKTGDLGEFEDGRLILKGRLAERIRRFGYTLSPRDVEWALLKHPKIREAYVLGLTRPGRPDDELVYFLVSSASEREVNDYCKANLPSVWRPDRIVFRRDIPRNRSGKPHLAAMKDMLD